MRSLTPLFLLLIAAPAFAQDRSETEQRLSTLRSQISGVEAQVSRARGEEQSALDALEGMNREIALREELVSNYRAQLENVRRETATLQRSIQRLEGEIERARASYRERARHAYMRGRASDLSLILSSGSIPQMIARARYLRQFADRRRRQVARISDQTMELKMRELDLNRSSLETQQLLTTSQFEQGAIAERRHEREDLVREVRRNRTNLEAELAQRQSDARSLEGIVAELVAQERRREEQRRIDEQRRIAEEQRRIEEASRQAITSRRAREAQQAAARRAEAATTASETSRAAIEEPPPAAVEPSAPPPPASDRIVSLSGSFRQNRGSLPRPVDGPVTGAFGTRTDPVYGTRITSPGIDISTPPAAGVRAVFEGVVERVGAMSTFGTYVMISHGSYTTIYGNLSSVGVTQGQSVRAGELIARAGTSAQRRGAVLFFAIFEGETAVDPSGWLR